MQRDSAHASQGTLACDEGDHGVFHAPVASLGHRVLRIGVRPNVFVDERHGFGRVPSQGRPIAVNVRIGLVNQVEVDVTDGHGFNDEVWVCRPREINHIVRFKRGLRPRGAWRPFQRFFGSLYSGGSHHVACRHIEGDFKVAPDAVKLPADVGIAVPSVMVKLTQPWVPLGHAVFDAFLVHPT